MTNHNRGAEYLATGEICDGDLIFSLISLYMRSRVKKLKIKKMVLDQEDRIGDPDKCGFFK
jgi:hypothetical protein